MGDGSGNEVSIPHLGRTIGRAGLLHLMTLNDDEEANLASDRRKSFGGVVGNLSLYALLIFFLLLPYSSRFALKKMPRKTTAPQMGRGKKGGGCIPISPIYLNYLCMYLLIL